MWHCYWKFVLRITNRNFGGPKVLKFSGGECLIPHAFQSSIVNLDKNTTLETPLYSNARYAPVEVILNSRIKNVLGRRHCQDSRINIRQTLLNDFLLPMKVCRQ